MMQSGKLFLLPCFIGDEETSSTLSNWEIDLVNTIKLFITENEKSCRRFMRKAGFQGNFDELELIRLDKNSSPEEINHIINLLNAGNDAALISEAGAPALADPGAPLIRIAHKHDIDIIPVPGPSAIMQAIVSSGLNGQQFIFHGYLPIDSSKRKAALRDLENKSSKDGYAHFFIETPYRNNALLQDLLEVLSGNTYLSIAANINSDQAFIRTKPVKLWKVNIPDLHKKPAVFGLICN
ncbi:MAG: SAM-dependent methyltransferase [Bacteroidia bacterium]